VETTNAVGVSPHDYDEGDDDDNDDDGRLYCIT